MVGGGGGGGGEKGTGWGRTLSTTTLLSALKVKAILYFCKVRKAIHVHLFFFKT